MRKQILTALAIFLIGSIAIAGRLQNSDFATSAEITGAGGANSQLLNTSKIWDSTNVQLLDTTIAAKLEAPVANASLATVADQTIKSNISGGVAVPSDNTLSAILDDILGTAQGSIIYRGAALWGSLPAGTSGDYLQTQGAGLDPIWSTVASSSSPLTTSGDIYVFGTTDDRLPVGTDGQVLSADSAAPQGLSWINAPSGDAVKKDITQASHGFSVGNIIYYTGSAWALARADVDSTSEVLGVVSAVAGANDFTVTQLGYVSGLSGLSAGTTYYLSPSSAGAATSTEPSAAGQVSKPVYVATSTTEAYVIHSRGAVIESQGASQFGEWNNYTVTVTGSSSNPTTGTVTVNNAKYKVVGDTLYIMYALERTTAGTAGSGTYLFNLPPGFTASSTNINIGTSYGNNTVGSASMVNSGGGNFVGVVQVYDSTNLAVGVFNPVDGGPAFISSTFESFTLSSQKIAFTAAIPIDL